MPVKRQAEPQRWVFLVSACGATVHTAKFAAARPYTGMLF